MRRMPRTPPKRPASKTTLSRGDAWPAPARRAPAARAVQSSCANTNAAKSTSRVSSSRRSSVLPGLKDVVQGSTSRDVVEPAGQRLEQLLLLSRRAEEDAGLVHGFFRRVLGGFQHAGRIGSSGSLGSADRWQT